MEKHGNTFWYNIPIGMVHSHSPGIGIIGATPGNANNIKCNETLIQPFVNFGSVGSHLERNIQKLKITSHIGQQQKQQQQGKRSSW